MYSLKEVMYEVPGGFVSEVKFLNPSIHWTVHGTSHMKVQVKVSNLKWRSNKKGIPKKPLKASRNGNLGRMI